MTDTTKPPAPASSDPWQLPDRDQIALATIEAIEALPQSDHPTQRKAKAQCLILEAMNQAIVAPVAGALSYIGMDFGREDYQQRVVFAPDGRCLGEIPAMVAYPKEGHPEAIAHWDAVRAKMAETRKQGEPLADWKAPASLADQADRQINRLERDIAEWRAIKAGVDAAPPRNQEQQRDDTSPGRFKMALSELVAALSPLPVAAFQADTKRLAAATGALYRAQLLLNDHATAVSRNSADGDIV
ncbi:hypothetical protein OOZ54_12510 [Rhodopseudomonas palustris]|uniref:hypothetical protein n=1 Tax=Rhodopseudomonas palustris TaxID=1076 RepID=UPI0022EFFEE9|nr:hypothetical protein [Rhodopseudomonas palustris]WBU27516.1 hypothetical protein OOZ54_12510 [Rhodopseudomonas palustris]